MALQLFRSPWLSYVEFHTRSPFKLRAIALVGMITFPLYYFIWTRVFPQPYESVELRAIGFGLSFIGAMEEYWPRWLKRYYLGFSYVSIMYGLPIFFTAMTLLNDASSPWLMSLMSAYLFIALLYDVANALIVSFAGSVLGAILASYVSTTFLLPNDYLASLPILSFTVLAVLTLSYNEGLIARGKLSTAHVLASHIAHEMRTHLLGIKLNCETCREEIIESALGSEHPFRAPSGRHVDHIHSILNRIENHTSTANLVIEMLLANVTQGRVDGKDFELCQLDDVIATAVDHFTFEGRPSPSITVEGLRGLSFFGSSTLMLHVFFNLLKNAINATEQKGGGNITISTDVTDKAVMIAVQDNGVGIDKDFIRLIFMPFVTSDRRMEGTGLGLPFCKLVIESFGGSINCLSKKGEGATFLIKLPHPVVVLAEHRPRVFS